MALATVIGALGTHRLKARACRLISYGVLQTAVLYQFLHALGLLCLGVLLQRRADRVLGIAADLLLAGVLLFSGSLYALLCGAPRGVGRAHAARRAVPDRRLVRGGGGSAAHARNTGRRERRPLRRLIRRWRAPCTTPSPTHRDAVLRAPPGAGKSTLVPLALLAEPWLGDRKILLLEPRRVAARAIARRMAWLRGEPVGGTVGYRMRLDTCVSRATRIEVITEGVLTRMLQSDPELAGVGCVIFDEFHERSLQADLGLALCLDARAALDADFRLLAMSATLDGARIAALLGDAPVIDVPGRQFEVDDPLRRPWRAALARAARSRRSAWWRRTVRQAAR